MLFTGGKMIYEFGIEGGMEFFRIILIILIVSCQKIVEWVNMDTSSMDNSSSALHTMLGIQESYWKQKSHDHHI